MPAVGQPERVTRNRVVVLFRDELEYHYLGDMDAEIAALEARLAKARQLKQGMMEELLTGRIRLPFDGARATV